MFYNKLISVILCIYNICNVCCVNYSFINLPNTHLPYYFRNFPAVAKQCKHDEECSFRKLILDSNWNPNACWGYEDDCAKENAFATPHCPGNYFGWVESKKAHYDTFYTQADFGYIKQQHKEMMVMCEPLFPHDSVLECSKYLRFCRGRNILVNFTDLVNRKELLRYKMDVLKQGQIGGYCKLYKTRINEELDHMSALQSWAPELRYFEEYKERPIESNKCDKIIEKPTFFMKIDAAVNMYHHFCDFFNLYASLHVNMSHLTSFTTDVNILIWETFDYESPFAETFKAFTKNPVLDLKTFRGETVCFKNLVFPLLPRMIFGLYYNTPIVHGCENSGLFQAFSEHILHSLAIPLHPKKDPKIRITLLSRRTKYRQILNVDDLIDAISQNETYIVKKVVFERQTKFRVQLEISRNTDIFIGMHGAGLTHLLFLPKWATLFELYHCEDPACYRELARLRGVNYLTWENTDKLTQQDEGHHPDGGYHAKFTNYAFDKNEFVRLVNKAADYVWNHKEYQTFIANYYDNIRDEL